MHFISCDFLGIPASFLIFLAEGSQGIFRDCRERFNEEALAVFLTGDLAILFGMTKLGLGLGVVLGIIADWSLGCSLNTGSVGRCCDIFPRSRPSVLTDS